MSCDCNTLVIGEAGPQGPQGFGGIDGTNGTDGKDAFARLSGTFVQPAIDSNVTIPVTSSSWMAIEQIIYISRAGYYQVLQTPSATSALVKFIQKNDPENYAPTVVVPANLTVSPSSASATLSLDITTLDLNQGYVSVNPAFRVNGSGTLHPSLIHVDATNNQVGINVNPSSGDQVLVVGGGMEITGDAFISYGAVKAARLQVGSATPKAELTKSLYFTKTATVILAGTVGACQRVSLTCTGAELGDVVTVGYSSDPVSAFEDSVAVSAVVSAANTVNVFFQNFTTNSFPSPGASINLNIVVNKYVSGS